jgi:hypothetical protein
MRVLVGATHASPLLVLPAEPAYRDRVRHFSGTVPG